VTDAPRRRPAPHVGTVVRTHQLSTSFVRVVVGGLDTFVASPHADSYVKLVFLPDGTPRPLDADGRLDLEAIRASLPPEDQPRMRAYTVRDWDAEARELTLDLVVHGTEGLAGPWAASVEPGAPVAVNGPGGAWSPHEDAAWHLLVGDASALPAIAVSLERLPADARGAAVLEVTSPDDELKLDAPAGVEVRYVHTTGRTPGAALVEAVTALDLGAPASSVSAFLHGEAGMVRALRGHLRAELGIPRDALSVSGYWRLGADDEGWRAGKRAWLADIESTESAAGLDRDPAGSRSQQVPPPGLEPGLGRV
jgi:NADPH-dependent ferric siderophore reductase